jgi:L-threonylcarbamoyladenylate synthase
MQNSQIRPKNFQKEILAGKIFIYPTDTLYGLGCDATNQQAVEKIKEIKSRDRDKPLSIIAPSLNWIKENLLIESNLEINKYLPGPYTILLKKKDPNFLSHISNNDSIGVRIPAHPITQEIQKAGVPFVTTSVNLAGEPFATNLKEIKQEITEKVDFIIESQIPLSGKPSTLIKDGKELERR